MTDCVTMEFFFVWWLFCREAISAAPMVTGCQLRLRERPRGRRSKGEACDVDLPASSRNHQVRAPHNRSWPGRNHRAPAVNPSATMAQTPVITVTPPMPTARARSSNWWSKRPRGRTPASENIRIEGKSTPDLGNDEAVGASDQP